MPSCWFGIMCVMEISPADIVSLSVAVIGCTLGVVNFVVDLVRHRPHAKVTFHEAIETDGYIRHVIDIVNVGCVPIVVRQVGLDCGSAGFIPVDAPFKGGAIPPIRIDPGDCATIGLKVRTYLNRDASSALRAFVEIPGGDRFYSKAIKTDLVAFALKHGIVREGDQTIECLLPHGATVGYAAP